MVAIRCGFRIGARYRSDSCELASTSHEEEYLTVETLSRNVGGWTGWTYERMHDNDPFVDVHA